MGKKAEAEAKKKAEAKLKEKGEAKKKAKAEAKKKEKEKLKAQAKKKEVEKKLEAKEEKKIKADEEKQKVEELKRKKVVFILIHLQTVFGFNSTFKFKQSSKFMFERSVFKKSQLFTLIISSHKSYFTNIFHKIKVSKE